MKTVIEGCKHQTPKLSQISTDNPANSYQICENLKSIMSFWKLMFQCKTLQKIADVHCVSGKKRGVKLFVITSSPVN